MTRASSPTEPAPMHLAIFLGLTTGFTEAVLLAIQRYGLGRMIFLSDEFSWMAPVGEALFFALAGSLLLLLRRWRPGWFGWGTTLGSLTALGVFAVLLMYPPLHRAAALLIAVGVGIQTARALTPSPSWLHRLLRTGTWVLLGVVLALFLVPRVVARRHELRRFSSLPPAAQGAPNILFIMLDTVRAASLSLYGYSRETTPTLAARGAEGVVFDWAIAPAPWTLPSHGSAFTGRWPHELDVDWRVALDGHYPTLAEVLAAHGYRTAGFAANTTYCGEESGLSRGFLHWEAYPTNLAMVVKSSSLGRALTGARTLRRLTRQYRPLAHPSADDINRELLDWLAYRKADGGGSPFFAFLNYYDAHAPYLPPAGFRGRFGPDTSRENVGLEPGGPWSAAEVTAQKDAYEESIAFLDSRLGELFDSLSARGELQKTLIVVAGDHGEEFLEHGVMDHGNTLYMQALHVPLLFRLPGVLPEGVRIAPPVSLRDIPATILEIAGIATSPLGGSSLSRFWRQGGANGSGDTLFAEVNYASGLPERYPVSHGPMRSVLAGGYHYILNGDAREELYRLSEDPAEANDLVNTPAGRTAAQGLRAILDSTHAPGGR